MITDAQLMFDDAAAVTVDRNSTNVIDLLTTADISRGVPMRFYCAVHTTFNSAGDAATLRVQLVQSAASDLSSPDVLWDSGSTVIPEATLVAGYVIADVAVPATSKRYLGVKYDNATEAFTAGKVTAELLVDTPTPQDRRVLGNTGL